MSEDIIVGEEYMYYIHGLFYMTFDKEIEFDSQFFDTMDDAIELFQTIKRACMEDTGVLLYIPIRSISSMYQQIEHDHLNILTKHVGAYEVQIIKQKVS